VDGFRRVVKCNLRRIRDAVLTVRAEDATKKGLHDTRKAPLIQCPAPSSQFCSFLVESDQLNTHGAVAHE